MYKYTPAVIGISAALLLPLHAALAAPQAADKEALGQLLYFDKNLSINRNQACASCHLPPNFVDPANVADPVNAPVSLGSDPSLNGGRNAPSAGYAAFSPAFHWDSVGGLYFGGQFWDGRANSLADQAKGPFLNPVEMAMPSKSAVLKRIAEVSNANYGAYKTLFKAVYDVKIELLNLSDKDRKDQLVIDSIYDMMADAIAAFEKTRFFSPFSSKFDYYLAGKTALSADEAKGLAVFNGKAGCNACHTSDPLVAPDGSVLPPLFTDFSYDNIGIPKSTNPLIANNPVDLGLGGRADIAALNPNDELGKFKVMSLRNIAVTAPYGHNGFFATLESIVHFYNTRDVSSEWAAPEVDVNVNHSELGDLKLNDKEEQALVAFLKTLTDGFGPPLTNFPFPPSP